MPSVMFGTLESTAENRKRRGMGFLCGLLVQTLVVGTGVLLAVLFPQSLNVECKHFLVTWLPELTPPVKPVVKPPRVVARVFMPKVKIPEPRVVPAPTVATLVMPKIQHPIPSPPVRAPEPPSPPPAFAPPSPAPKPQVAVKTGLFGGAPEPVTTKHPPQEVQTGGFGSPEGVPGRAQRGNPGNVPILGSFGLPEGPGVGNGTGGSQGARGVVASAGFGSGIAGGGTSGGNDVKVAMGGFEKVSFVAPAPGKNVPAPAVVNFQPIEILSKPAPVYTDEARRLGIQGEVALSVVFEASGAIRVLAVVKSLGHGLDQAAELAATQIRFKPAQHDGKPADFPATLRIQFRLADQNT